MKTLTTLADLTPDPRNPNLHTPEGMAGLEDSLQECGFGDSLTADRNGHIISGNARAEVLAILGLENAIVVQSDGTRPIIHQRTDLDLENDPDHRARRLSIRQNREPARNLAWDGDALAQMQQEGVKLEDLWPDEELKDLFTSTAGMLPIYEPNLAPSSATATVTEEEIARVRREMEDRLARERALKPLVCPHCGQEFFLDAA